MKYLEFDPYNCETLNTIIYDLKDSNDKHNDQSINKLVGKLLQCTYFDSNINMYVTVIDKFVINCNDADIVNKYKNINVNGMPIFSTDTYTDLNPVYTNTNIHSYLDENKNIINYDMSIFSSLPIYNVKYRLIGCRSRLTNNSHYIIPLIETNLPIKQHTYNVDRDNTTITMIIKPVCNIGMDNLIDLINNITYRMLILSVEPIGTDIVLNIPNSSIRTLSKLTEHIHKGGLDNIRIKTTNNSYAPDAYYEMDYLNINSHRWLREMTPTKGINMNSQSLYKHLVLCCMIVFIYTMMHLSIVTTML